MTGTYMLRTKRDGSSIKNTILNVLLEASLKRQQTIYNTIQASRCIEQVDKQ